MLIYKNNFKALIIKEQKMPRKAKKIKLKKSEKQELRDYISKGKRSARAINRARILLLSDEGKGIDEIVKILETSQPTIWRIRRRYLDEGLEFILGEKPRSGKPSKITKKLEAQLSLIACSEPPNGLKRWSLQMLADKLVELELVDSISHTHVGTLLKKMNLSLG